MKVELSEKEIRVIKVALHKHWINMTNDDALAKRADLQDFADCCYNTNIKFEGLDNAKPFQHLK